MTTLGIPSYQPAVMGTKHMVAANNYMVAQAGCRILVEGGNAVDAGVAGEKFEGAGRYYR